VKEESNVEVLCDFDGTITNADIGFRIIETFGGPGWREVEDAYQRGEKGSKEAIEEIFSLTRVSEQTLSRFVEEHFFVDPSFNDFLNYCRRSDMEITVLSDGFDFYIDLMLQKFKVDVPYLANCLRVIDNSLVTRFPYHNTKCGICGNCKMEFAQKVKKRGADIIYIGDGHSDRCASNMADVIFAKDSLAEYCKEQEMPYFHFNNFADILDLCRSGLLDNLGRPGSSDKEEKKC